MGKMLQLEGGDDPLPGPLGECHKCQGSITMSLLCSNDCPIFYKRIKVKKELTQKISQMKRLNSISPLACPSPLDCSHIYAK